MTKRSIRRKKLEFERKMTRNVRKDNKISHRYLKRKRVDKGTVNPLES